MALFDFIHLLATGVAEIPKSPQHDAVTTMLRRRDGARFPPDVTLGPQAKELNLGFIRPENLVSHGLRVFRCLLANSKRVVMCLLLRSGCRDGCPSGRF